MTAAAGDRPCLEMGSRRAQEHAAVAAARATAVAGFSGTSNLEAGRRYGLRTIGTAAHAFTLLHDDERSAFVSQVASAGAGTTLLVDTYDVEQGVITAVDAAGTTLGAVRLDSGDLTTVAREVREQLDDLGATGTRIVERIRIEAPWPLASVTTRKAVEAHTEMLAGIRRSFENAAS